MNSYSSGAVSALKSIKRFINKTDPEKENNYLKLLNEVCDIYINLYSEIFVNKNNFVSTVNKGLSKINETSAKILNKNK